jgi:hypothetical protein
MDLLFNTLQPVSHPQDLDFCAAQAIFEGNEILHIPCRPAE